MVTEYPHIDSIYKRDEKGKFILGQYSKPEFEYLKDLPWVWTEKVDGTNVRIMLQSDPLDDRIRSVTFGGKTNKAQMPTTLANYLVGIFSLDLMDSVFPRSDGPTSICLYGEGFGAGIQKGGGNYGPDQKFVLFDVKVGNWWLKRDDVDIIAVQLGIPSVPVFRIPRESSTLVGIEKIVAEGFKSSWGDFTAEGLVGVPKVELSDRAGRRIITKVKHKDYL